MLTFWTLLCRHIFNRLLIEWCQSVSGVFADISVHTHTHTRTHILSHTYKCSSGCHKLALGSSCATTEVESESRWRGTLAFYTNGENSHCPPWNTLNAQQRLHRDQKMNSFGQKHKSVSKQGSSLLCFPPPLISVTDYFGFETQLECVCVWPKRSKPVEMTMVMELTLKQTTVVSSRELFRV